ncbi:hypothetical protein RHOSPDRAFT_31444 [Rhodotorula sp. JG-1b]|nr:hypothetical protein RHOSPDRAFT_31444 [Rhodotorula sp. JG-1b]
MCPSRGRSASRLRVSTALLLLLLHKLAAAAPLTNADLIAYLGGTATGQSLATVAYTLTVLANETSAVVSLKYDGEVGEVGWLGWGAGTAMTDADFVICWPNSDGSWTLSHRTAPSTVLPTLVGSANSKDPSVDSTGSLRIVPSLSSKSASEAPAVVTWERPLKLPTGYKGKGSAFQLQKAINQPMIYANGPKNPGKAAQDADLAQHVLDAMGGTYLDLSAAFTEKTAPIEPPVVPVKGGSGSTAGTPASPPSTSTANASTQTTSGARPSGSGAGTTQATSAAPGGATPSGGTTSGTAPLTTEKGFLSYSNLILIHAICAGVAWTILAPCGVLQGYLTTPATLAALGAVLMAVQAKGGDGGGTFAHKTIGFVFVGVLIFQDLLGLWSHLNHRPPGPGRPPPPRAAGSWIHIFLGVALIVTGYYQVFLGMERYGVSEEQLVTYGYYGSTSSSSPPPPSPPLRRSEATQAPQAPKAQERLPVKLGH